MAKITPPSIDGDYSTQIALKEMMRLVEENAQKMLYRDNPLREPNHMECDIDMSGNALIVPEYDLGPINVPDVGGVGGLEDRVTAIENASQPLYSPISSENMFTQSYLTLWGNSTLEELSLYKPSEGAPTALEAGQYYYAQGALATSANDVSSFDLAVNKPGCNPLMWFKHWNASAPSKDINAGSATIVGELVKSTSEFSVYNQIFVYGNRHISTERYDPAFSGHTVDGGVQLGDGYGPGYNADGSADTAPYTLINGGPGYTAYSTVYASDNRQTGWDVENEIRTVVSLNPIGTDAPTQGWTYNEASIGVYIALKPRPPEPLDIATGAVEWPYEAGWFVDPNNVDEAFQYTDQAIHTSGSGTITFNCVISTDITYQGNPQFARAGTEVLIPSNDPRWTDQTFWEAEYAKEVARGKAPAGWTYGVQYPDDVTLNGLGSSIDPSRPDTRVYTQTKRTRPSFCSLVGGQVVADYFPGRPITTTPP